MITYRKLESEELGLLLPKLKELGWSIPHPELATGEVAEDDGVIVGFALIQFVVHPEPLWVMPEYRGQGVAESLADRVLVSLKGRGIQGCVTVAQNEFAKVLCERIGMRAVSGTLYVHD